MAEKDKIDRKCTVQCQPALLAPYELLNIRFQMKLENVAIDDVLPLKAARRDAIENGFNTNNLISMVSFTFTTRHHLIRLASAPYTSSPLAKLG